MFGACFKRKLSEISWENSQMLKNSVYFSSKHWLIVRMKENIMHWIVYSEFVLVQKKRLQWGVTPISNFFFQNSTKLLTKLWQNQFSNYCIGCKQLFKSILFGWFEIFLSNYTWIFVLSRTQAASEIIMNVLLTYHLFAFHELFFCFNTKQKRIKRLSVCKWNTC